MAAATSQAFFGAGDRTPAMRPAGRPDLDQMDEMLNLALEEQEDDPRALR